MRVFRRFKKSYALVPSFVFLRSIYPVNSETATLGIEKHNKPKRSIFIIILLGALMTPILAATIFGFQVHVVTSGSMHPAFNPGDVIVTKVQTAKEVKVGQVILVTNSTTQVQYSHRVTSVTSVGNFLTIVTKGDANAKPDEPVTSSPQIRIQTSWLVLPNIGYVLSIMRSPIAIGIALLMLLLIILWLEKGNKESEKEIPNLINVQKGILDV